MKRVVLGTVSLAAAAVFMAVPFAPVRAVSAANQAAVAGGVSYLKSQQAADGHINSSFAGDTGWSAIAFAAAGTSLGDVAAPGGVSLHDYLLANPPAAAAPATDWERAILAITADGGNPYNFGGTNYVAALKTKVSGGQLGDATAVNDDIFGLLALVAARTPITDAILQDEVNFIIAHQRTDGGFSYTTDAATGSDVDDTAAAIMALVAARDAGVANAGLAGSIASAKAYMLGTQNEDGGFPYDPQTPPEWGGPVSNASSTSWVLMAMSALGQFDSEAGASAQTFLRSKQVEGGAFASPYNDPGTGDVFDTAPAVIALSGSALPVRIYTGVVPTSQQAEPTPTLTPAPTPAASPTPTPSSSVLGASTSASPSPSPTPAASTSNVLGASTLPTVGEVSNAVLVFVAAFIAIGVGSLVYRLQRQLQ